MILLDLWKDDVQTVLFDGRSPGNRPKPILSSRSVTCKETEQLLGVLVEDSLKSGHLVFVRSSETHCEYLSENFL